MIEALLLGLATGPSCMLFCGPVAVPLFMSHMKGHRENAQDLLRFMGGRLMGYILAGLILGFTGSLLLEYLSPRTHDRFMLVSYLLAGTLMVIRATALLQQKPDEAVNATNSTDHNSQFSLKKSDTSFFCAARILPEKAGFLLLGLATGLNLCPPFIAMASRVLEGPVKGMISFLFFFLGTSVYMSLLLLFPFLKKYREKLMAAGRITMLMMGIYFIFFLGILDLGRWV